MSQNGPDKGAGSGVYYAAWAFFKKRELRGIKTTANKKAKKTVEGAVAVPDVQEIVLPGEMDDCVPIYGMSHKDTEGGIVLMESRYVRRNPAQDKRPPQEAGYHTSRLPPLRGGTIPHGAEETAVEPARGVSLEEGPVCGQPERGVLWCVCVLGEDEDQGGEGEGEEKGGDGAGSSNGIGDGEEDGSVLVWAEGEAGGG